MDERPRLSVVASLKSWGGIERKLVTLFSDFLARGIAPELVCIRGGEVPYPERMPEGVRTVTPATRSTRDGIPAIMRYRRARRPDAVLTAKDHAAQVTLLARALGRLDVPVFVKVINTLDRVARRSVQRFMVWRLYPRAHGVIANSTGVADYLEATFAIPRDRVSVIYNPTVTDNLAARAARPNEHPLLADSGGPPVALGAGRIRATAARARQSPDCPWRRRCPGGPRAARSCARRRGAC